VCDGSRGNDDEIVKEQFTDGSILCPDDISLLRRRSDCDYWDMEEDNDRLHQVSKLCRALNQHCDAPEPSGLEGLCSAHLSLSFQGVEVDDIAPDPSTASSSELDFSATLKGPRFVVSRGELIGTGSLGRVYKALDQFSGQIMAVKEILLESTALDQAFQKTLGNEIGIYKDLAHPHIVSYLGHEHVDDRIYIYQEYMPGGSVAQVLAQFGSFDESLICRYLKNMLHGLLYLHTRDPPVLHRDVKGANVMVGMDCTVKLADFGCSKRTATTGIHTLRGSISWMAPEVMRQSGYGRKADIWSLGCTLIEMSTARAPWGSFDNCMAAMVRIALSNDTPPIPGDASVLCANFISLCTSRSPKERPDVFRLVEHEFVSSYSCEVA